ncbi:twin-arginine translocation signal domain-containing protein [Haloarcula sp. S1CR25-12]|uniref:Twin-arginine translocation signal domain-containing protein n=1 Tax=Haloarcula saliterrae TaxID=2950534 RepID=A0ABU2FCD1_9EURY|nr:G8 domain-containing protein [Haloarcula sp. S1CR25-12]MDS0259899.1 twin-arginine translocation signal domain-containing protein [Haloarcula sp. S1CR25-12]
MSEKGSSRRTFLKGAAAGGVGVTLAGGAYTQRERLLGAGANSLSDHDHIARLVSDDQVTHRATGGNWAEGGSWNASVPGDGARVLIPEGTTVTLAGELDAALKTVRVDGRLRVDPSAPTRLLVDTMVVAGTGTLELGTPEQPVQRGAGAVVEFTDDGAIDEAWDPERVSRGLLALPGSTVRIAGAERTPWARATPPSAGDSSLTLAERPTDWAEGDSLVVAGVTPDENRDESVTVAGVSGSTVDLDGALTHDHVPPREEFDAYVAAMDRNVTLRSASEATKRRGHVMFMTTDVRVQHAAFDSLGRTDKSRPVTNPENGTPPEPDTPNPKARYACHFHRTGIDASTAPRVVEGCVVDGSPGWGYVNHHSNVAFRDNVSHDVFGAGFVAEVGNEIGSFERNFALRSTGTGGVPDGRQFHEGREGATDDFGHGGYGFWLQSPGVAVDDNVAAGHRHHGFVWWTRPKPDEQMAPERFSGITVDFANFPVENVSGQDRLLQSDAVTDGAVPSTLVKLRSFSGNTAFASGGGVDISRHRFADAHDEVEHYSVVDEFTAFNVGAHYSPWDSRRVPNGRGAQGGQNGISIRYSANVVVRNPTLVDGAGGHRGVGINRNHAPQNLRVENPDIEGWFTGIRAPPRGESPITGGRLDNDVDVHVIGGGTDRRWTPAQHVRIEDVTFGEGGRASVFMRTNLDDDIYGVFSPAGGVELDGTPLYFDSQRPDVVPYPTEADLGDAGTDAMGDLTEASPAEFVGKSNRELSNEFGLAVEGQPLPDDAGRRSDVVGGFAGGSSGSTETEGPLRAVESAEGSVYEFGTLDQGERLYVYDDARFRAVPGKYTGLTYLRPEKGDNGIERPSGYRLDLAEPADVFVAYDAESRPAWLDDWTDTGDSIGTDDGTRQVFRKSVDAGTTWLGGCPDTYKMYTVFVR